MSLFKRKERTELDNDVLPPTLHDEVQYGRQRVTRSSVSSGRDSYVGARVSNFFASNKDIILGVMSGLVIVLGILLFFAYRDKRTAEDLKNYDLTQFQAGDFADLKAEVKSDHDLIQAYGLQRTVIDNCKRK